MPAAAKVRRVEEEEVRRRWAALGAEDRQAVTLFEDSRAKTSVGERAIPIRRRFRAHFIFFCLFREISEWFKTFFVTFCDFLVLFVGFWMKTVE